MPKLLLTLLMIIVSGPLSAAELEDVQLPDQVSVKSEKLTLNGIGLRRVKVLGIPFGVYVAGLYVKDLTSVPKDIIDSDHPRRIVMQFVRDIDKEKLQEGWGKGFKGGCIVECDKYEPDLKKLNSLMAEFEEEDQIILDFFSKHVEVTTKGSSNKSGKIEGAAFVKNLMSVFLNEKNPDQKFRASLLGNHPKTKSTDPQRSQASDKVKAQPSSNR